MIQIVVSLLAVGLCMAESWRPPGLHSVRQVAGDSSMENESASKTAGIWILFKEECSVCLRQVKDLDCLVDGPAVHLIGFGRSEAGVLRKAKQWTPKRFGSLPVFMIDPKELEAAPWQGVVTPQVMFTNGTRSEVLVGYQTCDRLKGRWMSFLRENGKNGNS